MIEFKETWRQQFPQMALPTFWDTTLDQGEKKAKVSLIGSNWRMDDKKKIRNKQTTAMEKDQKYMANC